MKLYLLFYISLYTAWTVAQTPYTIKGIVKDQTDSLVFANALLLNLADSSLIKGSLINNGVLFIPKVQQDSALLKIESIDIESSFYLVVRPKNHVLDLGELIVNSGILLDAVNIDAIRPSFSSGNSGELIINVKGSLLENSTSLSEVLSKSPSIIVEDGKINVFGKGEAIVLVNGKLISSAQLQSIIVSNIDRIEVLSNPPAKYDASGKAVVNIILANNPLEGFLCELIQNTTYAKFLQSYTTLELNYRKNKLSLYGSYAQDFGRNWGSNILKRKTFSNLGTTESINDFEDQSNLKFYNTYNAGVTYNFNKKKSLSLEYTGSISKADIDANASTFFGNLSNKITKIITKNSGINQYLMQSINLNYSSILDTLGSNLFIGGQYFYFNSDNAEIIDEEITNNGSSQLFNRKNHSESYISFGTAQFDFQKYTKNNSGLLEIGVKGTIANNSGRIDFFSKKLNDSEFNFFQSLSNDFEYQENIGAIYAQFSRELNKKSNLLLGVRSELTTAKGRSNKLNKSVIDTLYFNVFPNIDWRHRFNSNWKANLSLSTSINRPSYQALDPFLFYIDSLTTSQGNPQLKPEYIFSIESNIRYKKYSLKFGYNHTKNTFRYAFLPGNNGQSSSTLKQINMQTEHSYLTSIQVPIAFKNLIRSFNIIGAKLDQVVDSRPEFATNGFIPRFYFFSNNTINMDKFGKLQVGFRYMGTRYDGLYYRKPFYNLSLGWSKKILKNKIGIQLLVDDIFQTNIVDGYYDLADAKVSYLRKMNTRLIRLTLSYNFGRLKEFNFSSMDVGKNSNKRIRK